MCVYYWLWVILCDSGGAVDRYRVSLRVSISSVNYLDQRQTKKYLLSGNPTPCDEFDHKARTHALTL